MSRTELLFISNNLNNFLNLSGIPRNGIIDWLITWMRLIKLIRVEGNWLNCFQRWNLISEPWSTISNFELAPDLNPDDQNSQCCWTNFFFKTILFKLLIFLTISRSGIIDWLITRMKLIKLTRVEGNWLNCFQRWNLISEPWSTISNFELRAADLSWDD